MCAGRVEGVRAGSGSGEELRLPPCHCPREPLIKPTLTAGIVSETPFSPGGQGGLVTTKLSPFSCPLPAGRWGHRSLLPGTVQLSYPAEVRNIIETADSDMYLLTADFSWECIQTAWHFCSLLSGA